jgi:excinuclease ABC subunit C
MAKSEYRRFKIKRDDKLPNDFASMQEVLTRRLNESKGGNPKYAKLPDLLIVDGGKGQVSSAVAAMQETGVTVPLAGLAKQFEYLYVPDRPLPIILERTSQALYMVQRIRDEAHRFANTYQAQLRGKKQTKSILDDIPGIGAKRRKALQLYFGAISKMKSATLAELAQAPGMNLRLAETVYDYLHDATSS